MEAGTIPGSRQTTAGSTAAAAPPAIANPGPLGLGAFALTTFVLSMFNANLVSEKGIPVVLGLALAYGGLAQLLAGMWEFKTGNTFGATAFSTYGAFWMSLASFVVLVLMGKVPANQVTADEGWFLLAFAIFNTYMLIASARLNVATFAVFLTLEVTEVVLFVGAFMGLTDLTNIGGYIGVATAIVAWYASAAAVVNSMRAEPILPVGGPLWTDTPRRAVTSGTRVPAS